MGLFATKIKVRHGAGMKGCYGFFNVPSAIDVLMTLESLTRAKATASVYAGVLVR